MLISAIHADVPVFKNVSKRSTTTNYHPVSLLYAVSKVFANNKFVDNQEINGLFLISVWFQVFSVIFQPSGSCN